MSTDITTELSPVVVQALKFTQTYKTYSGKHPAIREAMCLKTQFPELLGDLRADDLFAGRRPPKRVTYFAPIWWADFPRGSRGQRREGKQGGYGFEFAAVERYGTTAAEKKVLQELANYWEKECSWAKVQTLWDKELRENFDPQQPQGIGGGYPAMGNAVGFCVAVDLDKLLRRGIPGLMDDIETKRSAALAQGKDTSFYDGLKISMDIFLDVCAHYQRQARSLAQQAATPQDKERLEQTARSLSAIASRPPRSLHEAIQLVWLYMMVACTGYPEAWRLDVALGDFYAHDIDAGILTEEQAMELLLGLWKLFLENGETALCRIVLGGIGRRNEAQADRFALAAMEATRRHCSVTPQLTLRWHSNQNPQLLRKAFEVIGQGCLYPMLYNDDVVVPGIAKILNVPQEAAVLYHPLGCGEYMLAGCSPSLLDGVWNIAKTLEGALHNGNNCVGYKIGPATGSLESFDTFAKLYDAFLAQAKFAADLSARMYQYICQALPKDCAYLYASLLTDDCLERGRSLLDGGVRYQGACIMGHGFTNAADALTAIRKLVYQEKRFTLMQLVAALDADFVGYEDIQRQLLDAPKFGNDQQEADQMLVDLWRDINDIATASGKRVGLEFLTVSSVNPGGYWMGQQCGATADGRRKGEPFAIGNAPTAGFDKNGLTALFNSIARVDPANGGATTNFKLSADWFKGSNPQMEALFKVYFAKGGQQANITVVNRDDLAAAMKEPEKYPHVLVRLGGWAARFIDLDKTIQMEILKRTLH